MKSTEIEAFADRFFGYWSFVCRLIWILIAASTSLVAAPVPGEVAAKFFEKLRQTQITFEPDEGTAISSFTSKAKKLEIEDRWRRVLQDAQSKKVAVGPVNEDGDLAVVLLQLSKGYDPSNQQVVAIGLVKHSDQWVPAPVPGSFQNSGLGFSPELMARVEALEQWMELEQVKELQRLRNASADRLRDDIRAAISAADLRELSAAEVLDSFLEACEQQNMPMILGFLGGLENPLPEDWQQRLVAAEAAILQPQLADPAWGLLLTPEIPKVLVRISGADESYHASIACMDASETPISSSAPRLQLVELDVYRSTDGFWRLDSPELFSESSAVADGNGPRAKKLLDETVKRWHENWPSRAPKSVEDLLKELLSAPSAGDMTRELTTRDRPQLAVKAWSHALAFWNQMHGPETAAIPWILSRRDTPTKTCVLLQMVSPKHPERAELVAWYFVKSGQTWSWYIPLGDEEEDPETSQWVKNESRKQRDDWPRPLLDQAVQVNPKIVLPSPSAEEAKALARDWYQALNARELPQALSMLAVIPDSEGHARWLRNLGYEILWVAPKREIIVGAATVHGPLAAVPVEIRNGDEIAQSLMLVIGTDQGPKILLEVDLVPSSQRARSFLNRTAIDRLRDQGMKAAAASASHLLKTHEAERANSKE